MLVTLRLLWLRGMRRPSVARDARARIESESRLILVTLVLCASGESQRRLMGVMLGLLSQRGKRRLADARDAWACVVGSKAKAS